MVGLTPGFFFGFMHSGAGPDVDLPAATDDRRRAGAGHGRGPQFEGEDQVSPLRCPLSFGLLNKKTGRFPGLDEIYSIPFTRVCFSNRPPMVSGE